VAAPLLKTLEAQPAGIIIIASGTSCRHQIGHLSPVQPLHMAELFAGVLRP